MLLGAAQVFGAKGYGATSVEDVLQAAGVSRRTFYRFFRSKEDLFEELADAASMLFIQGMRNAVAMAKTPAEKIEKCLELYLRAPQSVGPIFQVLQIESSRPGTQLYARRQQVLETLIQMFDQGFRESTGRKADPLILRGLIAAHERIALHVFNESPGDEAAIQHAKRAMMHLTEAALGEPAPAPVTS